MSEHIIYYKGTFQGRNKYMYLCYFTRIVRTVTITADIQKNKKVKIIKLRTIFQKKFASTTVKLKTKSAFTMNI